MPPSKSVHAIARPCRRWSPVIRWTIWAAMLVVASVEGGHTFDRPPSEGLIREIRLGVAAHDVDGLWSGESKEAGPDVCGQIAFNRPLLRLLAADAYPTLGLSLNTRGDTSKIYGGILLEWSVRSAFFIATGVGLALHDGELETSSTDCKALGSRVLFRIPVEVGVVIDHHYRFVLAFDHISNAYLASPNQGMDTIGLMVGYRF